MLLDGCRDGKGTLQYTRGYARNLCILPAVIKQSTPTPMAVAISETPLVFVASYIPTPMAPDIHLWINVSHIKN